MRIDVRCRVCGERTRLDVGAPGPGRTPDEHLHLVRERLTHRPSFECFGGHLELRAPLPECWEVDWSTASED